MRFNIYIQREKSMRGITNELLFFLFHLTLLLLFQTGSATTECQRVCGDVSIPYPFGIGKGCFRDSGFEIYCNETNGTSKPYIFGTVEVINITLETAQLRAYTPISFACYNSSGSILPNNSFTNFYFSLINTPFRFSSTANKFTAIGCSTLAYIRNPYGTNPYMSGCLSICESQNKVQEGAICSGMGCCQTAIPHGLNYYDVQFDPGFNHTYVHDFNPCSYAFLADQEWYKFNSSDVQGSEMYYRDSKQVPLVLDWAILSNEACDQAKLNTTAYACNSPNSICINSIDVVPGYTCNCAKGYQGNPYIGADDKESCQDINECEHPEQLPCYGNCINKAGTYDCICPSGTYGNPTIQGGCQPKTGITLQVKILIAGLCTFLVTAVMYLVYEKAKLVRAKQKCFSQNGGLLLQEQINAHECVRFKLFPIEEIERATNNFHECQIRGRGGQGIVYEGILDDKRRVAVKKSILIDKNKKKDFAKEMYILSLINHKNVIKILGCCLEVEVPILVYEFISSGTLYQYIQNKNHSMSLGFRLKLAVDSASAFAYLHSDSSPPIVHGDVKSMNILLDEEYTAKISDFGGSLLPSKEINEAGIQGTHGYLDPESLMTGQLTEKSDVYSFAVVILELLTRKPAVYTKGKGEKESLIQAFKVKGLAEIIDDEIKYEVSQEQIKELEELLDLCLKGSGEERPKMAEVVARFRRIRELNQNLFEECKPGNIQVVTGESSYQTTYTAQYNSSGRQAVFELDYHLTR